MARPSILLRSVLHNIGVFFVGLAVAYAGTRVDRLLGLSPITSPLAQPVAWLLLAAGFLTRVWATVSFYTRNLRVISLVPQRTLVKSGPYQFSRNPLYLGGNVFTFFGAALLLGSPAACIATVVHLPLVDLFIRREEAQLELAFGDEWRRYKTRVRRWL